MKIKCPLCGCINYFTGLEDEGTKFCSECNTPLNEPKITLSKKTFCPYCGNELVEKCIGKYKCPSCNRSFIQSASKLIESTDEKEVKYEINKSEENAIQRTKKIKSVSDRFTNVPINKRISISKIKDSKCPFKYYKNYIEDPKEEKPFLSIELGLGQFFHSKVEWLFKKIASQNRKITREDILNIDEVIDEFEISFLWNGQLREPYKIVRGYHFNRFKNRLNDTIQNFNGYVIPRLLGHKVVKTEGALQIRTDYFVIRGKYDLITQDQNNKLILWDWKTGKMPKPDYYEEFTLSEEDSNTGAITGKDGETYTIYEGGIYEDFSDTDREYWSFYSKEFTLDDPSQDKKFYKIISDYTGTVTIEYSTDGGTTWTTASTENLSTVRAKTIKLRVRASSATAILDSISILYRRLRGKR